MKIIVFTYDRFNSITTSKWFEDAGLEHTVLCHTEEQRQLFIAGGRVKANRIKATGRTKGLSNNRNAALDMLEQDEWALFMVDDLNKVREYDGYDSEFSDNLPIHIRNTTEWGRKMRTEISAKLFIKRCEECIRFADSLNCKLVGFAGFTNPLFRSNKWKFNALADGRVWLVKKSHLRFDENVQLIDDVAWTAENIKQFGVVIVNQWILPECQRYTKGAFGSIAQRLPQRAQECEYLVKKYPGLVRFAKKTGWPPKTHIRLRPTIKREVWV